MHIDRQRVLTQARVIAQKANEIQVVWTRDGMWASCPYGTTPLAQPTWEEIMAMRWVLPNGEITKLA